MNTSNFLLLFAVFSQISTCSCSPLVTQEDIENVAAENRDISAIGANVATRWVNNAGPFSRQCYCLSVYTYGECTCPFTESWCDPPCFHRDDYNNWQCSGSCRPKCFPSTAKVTLENGKSIKMSELQVGDRVQTGGGSSYSKVRAFLKKQPSTTTTYKSIRTSSNAVISLSGNHLIYTRKSSTDKFHPKCAEQVSLGDEVLVNENDEFIPARVINISSLIMQGAFVPLTEEGSIVVDEVLASCYPSTDHDIAHLTMAPIQWFPTMIEWIFGDDKGFSVFVSFAEHMGKLMLPYAHYFN